MLLAVPVFLDIGYLVIIIDLKRWNANSMSEAFEPGSTAHFVYTVEIHFISFVYIVSIQFKSLFLLCGYTITTEFIFLVNFTLITVLTSIKLLLSLIFKKFNFPRGNLLRHLYILELTLFESPICSFFRKPRQEVTMNVEVVFFSLLFKRHTLILILIKLLYLPRINHYISV